MWHMYEVALISSSLLQDKILPYGDNCEDDQKWYSGIAALMTRYSGITMVTNDISMKIIHGSVSTKQI